MFETIVIGGGPAGVAAAVYCARKKMKTLVLTQDFGGQSEVSDDIGNWIGDISVAGSELAKRFEAHVRSFEGDGDLTVQTMERVESITKAREENGYPVYEVKTSKGLYETLTVIIGSGGRRRKLNVPGEDRLNGRGVVYCSTCDAPLFRGRDTVVIGAGNSGLEAVVDLMSYANSIKLLVRSDVLKGDATTQEIVKGSDKVEIIYHGETQEIIGDPVVSGLRYLDKISGEEKMLDVHGVFIEIGSIPNSELAEGLIELNKMGEIIVDHKTFETSAAGVYAAGDVADVIYKQNNISAGNGVSAALSAYGYIIEARKHFA
jgi:alkyl hydroperoxide reductase subunit F